MALSLNTKLPYVYFNLLMILASALLLLWFFKAVKNFYKALRIRSAILSDRIVKIKGLGSYLSYFEGATQSHIHSIVHTRQSKPPKSMINIYEPFHMTPISISKGINELNLSFELFCSVHSKILLLFNFNPHEFKKYMTTELRGRTSLTSKSTIHEFQCKIFDMKNNSIILEDNPSSGIIYNSNIGEILFEQKRTQLGECCASNSLISRTLSSGKYNIIIKGVASSLGTVAVVLLPQSTPMFSFLIKNIEEGKGDDNSEEVSNQPLEDLTVESDKRAKPLKESILSQYIIPNFRSITSSSVGSWKSSDQLLDPNNNNNRISENDSEKCENGTSTIINDIVAGLFWTRIVPPKIGTVSHNLSPSELLIVDKKGILYTSQEVFGLTQVETSAAASTSESDTRPNSSNSDDVRQEEMVGSETPVVPATSTSIVNSTTCSGGIMPTEECVVCLSESREVLLMPCRHLCVCHNCLSYIDKCPVCRSFFEEYIRIDTTVKEKTFISLSS